MPMPHARASGRRKVHGAAKGVGPVLGKLERRAPATFAPRAAAVVPRGPVSAAAAIAGGNSSSSAVGGGGGGGCGGGGPPRSGGLCPGAEGRGRGDVFAARDVG